MTAAGTIVGIQGGKGSFNELAALTHLNSVGIDKFELRYLHTPENVIKLLAQGDIKFGQFAIYNTLGGEVEESKRAIGGYKLDEIARYKIKIGHALMVPPQANITDIDTIMTHPQVLRQCKHSLKSRYEHLKLVSGEGELIDPAKVAEWLCLGKLPKNIAVLGSASIAKAHGLKIVADNMQDGDDNYTTFLLFKLAVQQNVYQYQDSMSVTYT